jgi:hypothetical protein
MDPALTVGKLSDPDAVESPLASEASFDHVLGLKRLYRRLDNRIIPCLWTLYFLASASRSNVGLALTMNTATGDGLSQHLGLSEHQISTGVALFYVAYVIFEVPSNLVSKSIRRKSSSSDSNTSPCVDSKDPNVHRDSCCMSCGARFGVVLLPSPFPSWSLRGRNLAWFTLMYPR